MKTIHALRVLGLAGLGSLIAAPALAQESGYYYGGLSVGQSRARIDEERISASLLAEGLTSTMVRDEKSGAFKLFGGYQFNRNFAIEAGYFNLGKFGFRSTTVPAGTLDGEIKLQGLNLDLVGSVPLTERLSALARIGVQGAWARDRFSGTGAVAVTDPNPRERAFNYKFGAGLQYAFSPSFLVRGEAERYRVNDAVGNKGDVNMYSVSLVFPFGRSPAPAPRPMAAPAYVPPAPAPVAAPPPPPPVVAQAPPPPPPPRPPVSEKVTFAADAFFDFDKSVLKPEARSKLDDLVGKMAGINLEVIIAVGHTDAVGTDGYNQKLSIRRSDSIKDYLVSKGVEKSRIYSEGKGEKQPVADNNTTEGRAKNRRVEIEVAGTR